MTRETNTDLTTDPDAGTDVVAEILAGAVLRCLAAQRKLGEKFSPIVSHVGLSSRENDRSL